MYKNEVIDIAIIGGGAAGLMCGCIAGRAANGNLNIALFDKNNKTGRKLLATGNGRCNLTNLSVSGDSFNSSASLQFPDRLNGLLSYESIKDVFKSMGLLIKTDSAGRAYPQSKCSSSVLDILRNNLNRFGVREFTDESIISAVRRGELFYIKSAKNEYRARTVVLACGGCASPVFGSDGSGYILAEKSGHHITKPFPSLAPIYVKENLNSIKGVRSDCEITVTIDKKTVAKELGELQINSDNISGICVFNISRLISRSFAYGLKTPEIAIDFLPDIPQGELDEFLLKNVFSSYDIAIDEILSGIINKKLSGFIIKNALDISPATHCSCLGKKEIFALSKKIKHFTLTACRQSDFNKAQVTAGGVRCEEIDFNDMSSKITNDLFFAGEIVDIDAACGGFNLSWAWASAILAGESAVKRCFDDKSKQY